MGNLNKAWAAVCALWQSVATFFTGLFRKLPLVGELLSADRRHVGSATKEFLWTTAAATLPLWLYPFASTFIFSSGPSFQTGVLGSVAKGDLYLYSAAIVGPLMFALTTNYAEWNSANTTAPRIGRLTFLFPYGTWFLVISLIIAVLSALAFGVIRYREEGQIIADLNADALVYVSVIMYLCANVCWFLVSVYKNALVDTAASTTSDERNFVRDFLRGQDRE